MDLPSANNDNGDEETKTESPTFDSTVSYSDSSISTYQIVNSDSVVQQNSHQNKSSLHFSTDEQTIQLTESEIKELISQKAGFFSYQDLGDHCRIDAVRNVFVERARFKTQFEAREWTSKKGNGENSDDKLWRVNVDPPDKFTDDSKTLRIKGTKRTKLCSGCLGRERVECPDCNGSGQQYDGSENRSCTRCQGRGKITCPKCNGKGEFTYYDKVKVVWKYDEAYFLFVPQFISQKSDPSKLLADLRNNPTKLRPSNVERNLYEGKETGTSDKKGWVKFIGDIWPKQVDEVNRKTGGEALFTQSKFAQYPISIVEFTAEDLDGDDFSGRMFVAGKTKEAYLPDAPTNQARVKSVAFRTVFLVAALLGLYVWWPQVSSATLRSIETINRSIETINTNYTWYMGSKEDTLEVALEAEGTTRLEDLLKNKQMRQFLSTKDGAQVVGNSLSYNMDAPQYDKKFKMLLQAQPINFTHLLVEYTEHDSDNKERKIELISKMLEHDDITFDPEAITGPSNQTALYEMTSNERKGSVDYLKILKKHDVEFDNDMLYAFTDRSFIDDKEILSALKNAKSIGVPFTKPESSTRKPLIFSYIDYPNSLEYLLRNNAVDAEARWKDLELTPLHISASENFQSTRLLFEYGADPNPQDKKGNTPLHYVLDGYNRLGEEYPGELNNFNAKHPDYQSMGSILGLTKYLLSNGADPDIKNKNGKKPFDLYKDNMYRDQLKNILKK